MDSAPVSPRLARRWDLRRRSAVRFYAQALVPKTTTIKGRLMCRSLAEGGRRCRGSGPAARRAKYAVTRSAAARTVEQALATGEIDESSIAYEAYQQARAVADRVRTLALAGEDQFASKEALKAKHQMLVAVALVKKAVQEKARVSEINARVNAVLQKVNPRYEVGNTDYSENCSSVVQAYELQRRELDVQAGPRTGISLAVLADTWGSSLRWPDSDDDQGKAAVERAFNDVGSRGIVYVAWKSGGAHVFNVENVGGKVRFVDGQPTPPVTDASHYFALSKQCVYMRVDDKPTPTREDLARYLQE
ncbi:toxin glutamine deamidase domain-containing protein [Streptomyces sp. NPDC101455]|uniref:toxin glutamine deamidase domain-containing protein n=1 Tax=Streptomyces sp. NPDC101455 TaxID=3366142 RepID=UPI0038086C42